MKVRDFSIVDLFCGVGGLTHGFVKENFHIDAGIDFDKTCKYAFEQNNKTKFYHKDITQLNGEDLLKIFSNGKRRILVGCAPCQPFSIYNRKGVKRVNEDSKSDKWKLLYSFAELVNEISPEIVSMENVPLLLKYNNGKVFNDFKKNLEDKGYFVSWYVVNAKDYGVPQRRKRLVLFASKYGNIKLVDKTVKDDNFVTVRKAIGHLPTIHDGIADQNDPLHIARKLSDLNKKRIKATKEGGNWEDWDESLLLECHKKESGKHFKSVYGRMKWNDVAPTMTTYCTGLSNGRFGHPDQDRAISLREAALIQSFPNDYTFINPNEFISNAAIARQIGNAVPVELGVAIAKSIKVHIQQIKSS